MYHYVINGRCVPHGNSRYAAIAATYKATEGMTVEERRATWARMAREERSTPIGRERYNEYMREKMREYRASHPAYREHEREYWRARKLRKQANDAQ
jgi:hypothetical protein